MVLTIPWSKTLRFAALSLPDAMECRLPARLTSDTIFPLYLRRSSRKKSGKQYLYQELVESIHIEENEIDHHWGGRQGGRVAG